MSQELELARARAKAKLKLRQQQMTHTEPVAQEPEMEEVELPTELESTLRGAQQAATLEFGDEINAAVSTVADFASGENFESLEDISNNYNKRLNESRESFALAEEANPLAYKIGTGIGTAASIALPGGAIAKTAGTAAKVAQAAKTGAAFGAFASLGKSEDKLSLDAAIEMAEGAAIGGAAGAAMVPVAGAIGKIGHSIQNAIPENMQERIVNKAFKGIGLRTEAQRVKFAESLQKKGVAPMTWLKRIAKETDIEGKPLVGNLKESYKSIFKKTDLKIASYAKERDSLLQQANLKIDRKQVASRIKSALVNNGDVSPSEAQALNKLVDENILYKSGIIKSKEQGDILGMIPDESPLDAVGLSEIRKNLDAVINFNSSTNANGIKRSIRNSLNDYTDDLVASAVDMDASIQAGLLRSKMADLYSLQDSLQNGMNHVAYGDKALFKDVAQGAKYRMAAGPLGEKAQEIAGVMGIAFRKLSASPEINRNIAFNAGRLADALPSASEKAVRRLVALSDHDDPSKFNIAAAGIVAETDLRQSPVQRTWESVQSKKDSILALANDKDPAIAEVLQKAFDANDKGQILSTLDTLSKDRVLGKLFAEGVGFDGKVYTQEDKAVLRDQLKKNIDIPAAQRKVLLNDLESNGTIPDLQKVVIPVPQPHVPRTKKVHNY